VTLVVNTWLASTFGGVAPDPAVPVYAIGGLGGVALAAHYLRSLDCPHPPAPSAKAATGAPDEGGAQGGDLMRIFAATLTGRRDRRTGA
jgi:hypothetical protein